jgi:hypothetical protein
MPVHGQAPARRWVRPPTRSARPIDRIARGHRRCFAAEHFVLLLFPKAARPALRKGLLAAVGSSVGAIGVGAVLGLEFIDRKQVSLVPQVYSGALVCLHHLLNELLLSIHLPAWLSILQFSCGLSLRRQPRSSSSRGIRRSAYQFRLGRSS